MKKLLIFTILASIIIFPLTSFAKENVLRVKLPGDIVNLDPAQLRVASDRLIDQQVFEGLVQFDWTQKAPFPIKPRIAKSYEVSGNGLEITFNLNKGIQFHHGYGELTAEDVVFSLNRHMDPKVNSMSKALYDDVDKIRATGPYTVKVNLKVSSTLIFLQNLAWQGGGMIISKKAVEKLGDRFSTSPVGTGPYYFEKWNPGQEVILKKFKDYWGAPDWGFGTPAFDEVRFLNIPDEITALNALEKGEIDIVGLTEKGADLRAKQIKGIKLSSATGGSWQHLVYLNHKIAPTNDIRVRKALAHALDLKAIANRLGMTIKRFPSPFNEVVLAATDEFWTYDYNVEKAKKLLSEAGYPNGFKLKFIYGKRYMYEDVAMEVANYWSKIVNVDLEIIEYGVFVKKIQEFKHHAAQSSITRFSPSHYAEQYITNAPFNLFGYSNPAMDELIKKANLESNEARAKEMWRRFQKNVLDEVIGIYPGLQTAWFAISDRVKDVIPLPFGTLMDLAKAQPAQ